MLLQPSATDAGATRNSFNINCLSTGDKKVGVIKSYCDENLVLVLKKLKNLLMVLVYQRRCCSC